MFARLSAEIQRLETLIQRLLSRSHDPAWLTQAVWHIDFDNGNNSADGLTQATALLTFGELRRRVGDDFTPPQDVDIYCYGNNKPTDPWAIDGWNCSVPRSPVVWPAPAVYTLRQIRVHQMTPRVYYTGTITALQAAAFATNTPYVMTDVNAIGANQTPPVPPPNNNVYWFNPTIDWFGNVRASNHDQQRIRITSGPRTDAVAWTAAANLGAFGLFGGGSNGAIRMSNFGIAVPFGYTANFATVGVTAVVPQVGDPYVVEELPLLYLDRLVMKGNGDYFGSGIAFNGFTIRLVNGGDSQAPSNLPPMIVNGSSIVFVNCAFDFSVDISISTTTFSAFFYFVNCSGIDGIFTGGSGGVTYVDAGQYHLALGAADGAVLIVDADAMITTGAFYTQRDGQIWINSAQVWDFPGHSRKAGIMCFDHGTAYFFGNSSLYGTDRIWGVDQTGGGIVYNPGRAYAVAAFDGGRFLYNPDVPNIQNLMTIDGHVQWFGIGLSWQNGEKAVTIDAATMLPTTFRDTSKANLFGAIGGGGFGGRAVDPETYGLIAPYTSPTKPTA